MKVEAATSPLLLENRLLPYWELTKPRITFLVLLTTAAGFYLGSPAGLDLLRLAHTILGTALVAAGTAVLNQYLERENDGRMARTARRPLPSGRLAAGSALLFGLLLVFGGVLHLMLFTNGLTTLLGAATSAVYLLLYTPLKTRTELCTTVGAVPGAAPPLMGWAAARGSLDWDALVLFGVLFLWQFPHFLAIAWVYQDDYRRGGFKMLPVIDPEGRRTAWRVLIFGLLLLGSTLLIVPAGLAGWWYLTGAALLGIFFFRSCLHLALDRTRERAHQVLRASVLYLPLLLAFMILDKS